MSSIGKLEKFRQNESFKCLLQPAMEEIFRKDYPLKGKWGTSFFGNSNPITLELGCGKGEYTVALAERYPLQNFIGIDRKGARLWRGAKYVETSGLGNAGFVRTNIDFIEWLFGEDEIKEIWITFADPQLTSPRKRLTSTLFLERYRKFLKSDGVIHLKTDSIYLYEYTVALASQNNLDIICKCSDIYNAPDHSLFPGELCEIQTFYEKNYLSFGLPIKYIAFRLCNKERSPLVGQLVEPQWDKEFWLKKEREGREKVRIADHK